MTQTSDAPTPLPQSSPSSPPLPMPAAAAETAGVSSARAEQKKRKRKRADPTTSTATPTLRSYVLRSPTWFYVHLAAIPRGCSPDVVSVRRALLAALAARLGDHGAAVPLDLLRVDEAAGHVWLRTPHADGPAVLAAVGGALDGGAALGGIEGWRVVASGCWLAALVGRDEASLFEFQDQNQKL